MSDQPSLFENNGRTISLKKFLSLTENMTLRVPAYQRNYTWKRGKLLPGEDSTAVRLTEDLLQLWHDAEKPDKAAEDKTLGLITVSSTESDCLDILDGQQRLITLTLIYRALHEMDDTLRPNLCFERDQGLEDGETRAAFLRKLRKEMTQSFFTACTDKRRLQHNYNGIRAILESDNAASTEPKAFWNFIAAHVKFLLHVCETEPIAEFMNLNYNKTRFSLCDYVRANLISFCMVKEEQKELSKKLRQELAQLLQRRTLTEGITVLFDDLSRLLAHQNIYDLVKLGYDVKSIDDKLESPLNLLCIGLPNVPDMPKGGYQCAPIPRYATEDWLAAVRQLVFIHSVLKELERAEKQGDLVPFRAFKNYHAHKHVRFFDLLRDYVNRFELEDQNKLAKILHIPQSMDYIVAQSLQGTSNGEDLPLVNSLFQVMEDSLEAGKTQKKTVFLPEDQQENPFFLLESDAIRGIIQTSGKQILNRYFLERDRVRNVKLCFPTHQAISLEQETASTSGDQPQGKSGQISLGELLEDAICIPAIQRDYCLGNYFKDGTDGTLLDFLVEQYKTHREAPLTLSAITMARRYNYKMVPEWVLYDGQQRIVTLIAMLSACGKAVQAPKFAYRAHFQQEFEDFLLRKSRPVTLTFAANGLYQTRKVLCKKLENDPVKLADFGAYLLEKVQFNVMQVENLSAAEQFFMEINGGVALKPFEIFKCRLIQRLLETEQLEKTRDWAGRLDNRWLDGFYRFAAPELANESAREELWELRMVEYCCRMLRLEQQANSFDEGRKVLNWEGFANKGKALGSLSEWINQVTREDFDRIANILDALSQVDRSRLTGVPTELAVTNTSKRKEGCTYSSFGMPQFVETEDLGWRLIGQFVTYLGEETLNQLSAKKTGGKWNKADAVSLLEPLDRARSHDLMTWSALFELAEGGEEAFKRTVALAQQWNRTYCSEPFAYLTPYFVGCYPGLLLPIPLYHMIAHEPYEDRLVEETCESVYKYAHGTLSKEKKEENADRYLSLMKRWLAEDTTTESAEEPEKYRMYCAGKNGRFKRFEEILNSNKTAYQYGVPLIDSMNLSCDKRETCKYYWNCYNCNFLLLQINGKFRRLCYVYQHRNNLTFNTVFYKEDGASDERVVLRDEDEPQQGGEGKDPIENSW